VRRALHEKERLWLPQPVLLTCWSNCLDNWPQLSMMDHPRCPCCSDRDTTLQYMLLLPEAHSPARPPATEACPAWSVAARLKLLWVEWVHLQDSTS
jgi:hypothetical protein